MPEPVRLLLERPVAITMWEFSWLERRWPGAGYEDWDRALDELAERGYDAVRLDAFPHLIAAGPTRDWTLKPQWNQQLWGSPALNVVSNVEANLHAFVGKCRERGIRVGLSSWFREDEANTRLGLTTPEALGRAWARTLRGLEGAGLLDALLYVDLCNEFPYWTPFYPHEVVPAPATRTVPEAKAYQRAAIETVRAEFPGLPYCFSYSERFDRWPDEDVTPFGLLELHVWMAQYSDFNQRIGYPHSGLRFCCGSWRPLHANANRCSLPRA